MAQNYNDTIHKMKTPFEMRAGLPKKEPRMLEDWQKNHVYEQMIKNNEGKPRFILHDGPPYANGSIHMGTALNKIIKDIILRYKNMAGFCAPYVPGYDTHGLPIELKALGSLGDKKNEISQLELRRICREFATEHIDLMNSQFQRLGVQGDFDDPYLTLKPEFEARQVEIFGKMALKGYIYKGRRVVYWCPEDQTALAEAEIEYGEDPCDSIYVRFKLTADPNGVLAAAGVPLDRAWVVIWTTTTWTLPANVATCVHPDLDYVFVKVGEDYHLMAEGRVQATMAACGITDYTVLDARVPGRELELMEYQHPFLDRKGLVILGNHVTLESGTGCVHTAPGHGEDDFNACVPYPQLPFVMPVDAAGRLTEEGGREFAGLKVWDANKAILEHIRGTGHLLGVEHIIHQYPHCWRCHHPIIYRATEQWFCSIDPFKQDVYKAIDAVKWQPAWGHDRMTGMVRDRSDWCISRQRVWGVPIPAFYCKKCGKYHITETSIRAVSDLFRREGSDAWYKYDANDIMPKGETCSCGAADWEKDHDIMDVWFDSGSTWSAVCRERPELAWPVDLYMEGADQFRGWFQSSLLTCVATEGVAPYKGVLCHGWVVDAQGKQMHKSAGNGMEPAEIIRDYGADIIRLWVASSDYTVDVRAGKEIFRQLSEAYRKMRNTARFMLGNLEGFDPARDCVADDQLFEIDRWALEACNELTRTVRAAYDSYDFSRAYHAIYNFCVIDMSNFYMDVIKDRLYCADLHARRCAQTALYRVLVDFTKLLAPILCFTSQEIWSYVPKCPGMKDYVVFEQMPEARPAADAAFADKWARIMAVRDDVKKVLEQARADKVIGSSLEAALTLYAEGPVYELLNAIPMNELADLMIVSRATLVEGKGGVQGTVEGLGVEAGRATGNKCLRCWKFDEQVGEDGLCPRCARVLDRA